MQNGVYNQIQTFTVEASQLVNIVGAMDDERQVASMSIVHEYIVEVAAADVMHDVPPESIVDHEAPVGTLHKERMRLFLIFNAEVMSYSDGFTRASPKSEPEWILTGFRLPPPWPITSF